MSIVVVEKKSKGVAAVLALFLGGIGVQHFYLGSTVSGVLSLLFCWTLIPAFIGVIQALGFLMMKEEKFDYVYNGGAVELMKQSARNQDPAGQLRELNELRNQNIITDKEFEKKKASLLK